MPEGRIFHHLARSHHPEIWLSKELTGYFSTTHELTRKIFTHALKISPLSTFSLFSCLGGIEVRSTEFTSRRAAMADGVAEMEGGIVRTLKDLFAGAAGGVAQVLIGMGFFSYSPSPSMH